MVFLIGLIAVSVCGIGVALWLLKNDKEAQGDSPSTNELQTQSSIANVDKDIRTKPDAVQPSKPKSSPLAKFAAIKTKVTDALPKKKPSFSLLGAALKKFKLGKRDSKNNGPSITPMPNLKEYLNNKKSEVDTPELDQEIQTGTTATKTLYTDEVSEEKTLSKEEEKEVEKEIEITAELNDLKEKYEKLEALFDEKSAEFEKTKDSLNHELENRKEFNKVKDLLEKEIKDSKDNVHNVQTELNNSQIESERHKKRSSQLEEKTAKLEKDLLEKEDKINDLVKRIQTFASPPPPPPPPPSTEKQEEENNNQPPPDSDAHQAEAASPAEESKDQPPLNGNQAEAVTGTPRQEETPSQDKESLSEEEGPKENPIEAGEDTEEKAAESNPVEEQPKQINEPGPNVPADSGTDDHPKEDQSLKFQSDVPSDKPQKDESNITNEDQPPPEKKSDEQTQTPIQPENNNNTEKE